MFDWTEIFKFAKIRSVIKTCEEFRVTDENVMIVAKAKTAISQGGEIAMGHWKKGVDVRIKSAAYDISFVLSRFV